MITVSIKQISGVGEIVPINKFPLKEKITIGRDKNSIIVIDSEDMLVSRNHVIIYEEEEKIVLKNLGGNGTIVNGSVITDSTVIESETCVITVGNNIFKIDFDSLQNEDITDQTFTVESDSSDVIHINEASKKQNYAILSNKYFQIFSIVLCILCLLLIFYPKNQVKSDAEFELTQITLTYPMLTLEKGTEFIYDELAMNWRIHEKLLAAHKEFLQKEERYKWKAIIHWENVFIKLQPYRNKSEYIGNHYQYYQNAVEGLNSNLADLSMQILIASKSGNTRKYDEIVRKLEALVPDKSHQFRKNVINRIILNNKIK